MNITVDTSRLTQDKINELTAKAKALFDEARAAIPTLNQLLLKAIDESHEYERVRLNTDKPMETRERYLISKIKEAIHEHMHNSEIVDKLIKVTDAHTNAAGEQDDGLYEGIEEAIFQLFD